jgi:hypothetical protein
MRFRPDSFEMIEGETNKLQFNLGPAAGISSVSGTPVVSATGLTFASTAISGNTVTTFVSGGTAGRDYLAKVVATLSSGETKIGTVRLEWKEPGYDCRAGV